ncbi:transposase [Hymenobacter coccineus]|uniref:transposase n=1 Tax=Hymenobacter coccineus TaxID=1908235 RepID=UPI0009F6039C
MGAAFTTLTWANPNYRAHTRLFVEAVLWRARCGVWWRDLPAERFGPWHTVYALFRRWRQAGVGP